MEMKYLILSFYWLNKIKKYPGHLRNDTTGYRDRLFPPSRRPEFGVQLAGCHGRQQRDRNKSKLNRLVHNVTGRIQNKYLK